MMKLKMKKEEKKKRKDKCKQMERYTPDNFSFLSFSMYSMSE